MRSVDIVAGGQFGDEGKGQICAFMAARAVQIDRPYHYAVRVGGSNAEHRFVLPDGRKFTARVLPVAGWADPDVKLILGPGHMIKLDSFIKEVSELEALYGFQTDRILIDPNAGVIGPEHIGDTKNAWRGTTGQGVGKAVAHKALRDGKFRTAKDYPELAPYIYHDGVWRLIRGWVATGQSGLLEGSQGALLSLDHGYYPFCTSKNATPAALLAEAGIPTSAVRGTVMVYRAVPMRVPGRSGPTGGQEIDWEQLEAALGTGLPESAKRQTDSGDRERVFLWSWEDFEKSIALCAPTAMVLTFADWWPGKLMGYPVEELVGEMQLRARCPVLMVRNGPLWGDFTIPHGRGEE